jgi:photosystem II stability/assembly factor-like uncharacterized protein
MTITLPSLPAVGDVYKAAAVGAGGWIITQNAYQKIAAGNLSHAIGQSWKVNPSTFNWSAIASSADGTRLVATIYSGNIYTSTNSGANWLLHNSNPINSLLAWSSVASSADGTRLVATVGSSPFGAGSGYIYTSSDSGASWVLRNSSPVNTAMAWTCVASSADGTKLVAVAYNGYIYTSSDSGASWVLRNSSPVNTAKLWTCVASSASGTNLAAGVDGGYIYTSSDSGVHWAQQTGSGDGSQRWSALASSSDGVNLIAATTGSSSGKVYTSSNLGTNWMAQTVSSVANASWSSVASSADGSHLAAVYNAIASGGISGNIFTSDDFGATWTERNGAPTAAWSSVASSADGSLLAATATTYGTGSSGIYVSSQSGTTAGTAGYLIGPQHSAIELIYVGNNLFLPLSHEGTIRAY